MLGVGDDALFTHQPLGFSFPMAGSAGTGSWTHVRVCTNGWLVLTDGTSSTDILYESSFVSLSLVQLYGGTGSVPRIAPFWGDLDITPANGGGVYIDSASHAGVSTTITWRNAVEFGVPATMTFQVELFATGHVEFRYSPGMGVNTSGSKYVAVSASNGTPVQVASDFVPGPVSTAAHGLHQRFTLGSFDLGGRTLRFAPNGGGWTTSNPCTSPDASHNEFGQGCYAQRDSVYALFQNPSFASWELNGKGMRLVPDGDGYLVEWLPSQLPYAIGTSTPPLPMGDDTEATVSLPWSFPTPWGGTTALRVSSNGIVAFGAGALDFQDAAGGTSWQPSVATLLNSSTGGIYSWSDLNVAFGGAIRAETAFGICVVEFDNVHSFDPAGGAQTFQFQFHRSTGEIYLLWQSLSSVVTGNSSQHLVGWSAPGASPDLGPTVLSTDLPLTVVSSGSPLLLSATPPPVSTSSQGTLVLYQLDAIPEYAPQTGARAGVVVVGFTGVSAGVDLGFLGMPGCNLYLGSLDLFLPFAGASASQTVPFQVPAGLAYGSEFFAQALALVSPGSLPNGQNPFGAVVSNGVRSFVAPQ